MRTAWVASAVVAAPPRSRVRRPSASARSTADSIAAASLPSRVRGAASVAADRNIASGLATPVPAMSGAEPCTGSNRPGLAGLAERGARQHPDRAGQHRRLVAEDVAEHVLGDDHVEVARRRRPAASRRCRRAGARARRWGTRALCSSRTTSRHSRLVSSTLALSTLVTARAGRAERDPRDPLDLLARVDAGVRGAVGGARLLAEVDPAGQLAHDQQVGALDHLALQRAGVVQRRQRAHRPQVGEQAEALAQPEQALLGPGLGRVGACPTWARRRPPAAPRRRPGRRRASHRSARCRGRRSRRRRTGARLVEVGADGVEHLDRGGDDLGADPVAGQQYDGGRHEAAN